MGLKIEGLNLEKLIGDSSAAIPSLSRLYSPGYAKFELNIITRLVLQNSSFDVQQWIQKRMKEIQDVELNQRLTAMEDPATIFLVTSLIAASAKKVEEIEQGKYEELIQNFGKFKKELYNARIHKNQAEKELEITEKTLDQINKRQQLRIQEIENKLAELKNLEEEYKQTSSKLYHARKRQENTLKEIG